MTAGIFLYLQRLIYSAMTTVTNVQAMPAQPTQSFNTTVKINLFALLGLIGTTFVVSIIGTAFAVGGVLNSDHFLLSTTARAVDEIKANQELYVRSDVYEANQQAIITSLLDIKNDISVIDQKLTEE